MESKEHGKQAELLKKEILSYTLSDVREDLWKYVESYSSLRVSEAVEAATDKLNIDIANQDAEIIYLNEQLTSKDKEIAEYKTEIIRLDNEIIELKDRQEHDSQKIAELKDYIAFVAKNLPELEQAKKENLITVLADLDSFKENKADEECNATDHKSISRAEKLILRVYEELGLLPYFVVPTRSGGVGIEYRSQEQNCKIFYYRFDNDGKNKRSFIGDVNVTESEFFEDVSTVKLPLIVSGAVSVSTEKELAQNIKLLISTMKEKGFYEAIILQEIENKFL